MCVRATAIYHCCFLGWNEMRRSIFPARHTGSEVKISQEGNKLCNPNNRSIFGTILISCSVVVYIIARGIAMIRYIMTQCLHFAVMGKRKQTNKAKLPEATTVQTQPTKRQRNRLNPYCILQHWTSDKPYTKETKHTTCNRNPLNKVDHLVQQPVESVESSHNRTYPIDAWKYLLSPVRLRVMPS